MYVYADPYRKTCEIVESNDILDAIAISNGRGIIYMTDDSNENPRDASDFSEDQVREAMDNSIAWKDGVLSNLGKALVNNYNFRNYID
jgi:hypothetical protein